MPYSVVNIEEIEGTGPGGVMRFVRRELGVEAFGINWFELSPNADGFEHDEQTSRQEEVVVVSPAPAGGGSATTTYRSRSEVSSGSTPARRAAPTPARTG